MRQLLKCVLTEDSDLARRCGESLSLDRCTYQAAQLTRTVEGSQTQQKESCVALLRFGNSPTLQMLQHSKVCNQTYFRCECQMALTTFSWGNRDAGAYQSQFWSKSMQSSVWKEMCQVSARCMHFCRVGVHTSGSEVSQPPRRPAPLLYFRVCACQAE